MCDVCPHEIGDIHLRRLRELGFAALGLIQAVQQAEQQGGLVLEVVVDGAVRHAGCPGHLPNRGALESLLGKHPRRGIQDTVAPPARGNLLRVLVRLQPRGTAFGIGVK